MTYRKNRETKAQVDCDPPWYTPDEMGARADRLRADTTSETDDPTEIGRDDWPTPDPSLWSDWDPPTIDLQRLRDLDLWEESLLEKWLEQESGQESEPESEQEGITND